tara:strand:- start:14 stop:1273 length:1260 start_codon:yes stop_codon:yes gene_type:complete
MTPSKKTRIVIAGVGFGGVYTYKQLHKHFHKNKNVELVLINETNYFLFTPLLHEVATGSISPENIIEPLRKVLRCCLSDIYIGSVKNVNTKKNIIETTQGPLAYDYLVLALGSQSHFFGTPGADEHAFTLKTLEDAITLKNHFITQIERASKEHDAEKRKELLRCVIIGGGPTGVELATETADLFYGTFSKYYPKHLMDDVEILLIQKGEELVPMFPKKIRQKAKDILKKHHIKILFNTKVTGVTKNSITTTHKKYPKIATTTPIWTAGVAPRQIPSTEDFAQNKKGCIIVRPTLQTMGNDSIFVLGDMAHCVDPKTKEPLPALAQVAVQQGKFVADNIAALIEKKPLTSLTYSSKGLLISLGQWMAAGQIAGVQLSGRTIWWLWRSIYVSKLISWQKKLRVIVDWTINLFSPRDISKY